MCKIVYKENSKLDSLFAKEKYFAEPSETAIMGPTLSERSPLVFNVDI